VYLARERLLERLVAIKVLRSEFVSADSRERFIREARTAAKLMHANIVPLYSFGQAGDTLYYIMGYVEGESLESTLTRVGRLDFNEARRILVEVADALGYAHRNGVVHRDVKPDNILIERDSRRALLTDFGIAKIQSTQSTLTQTGHIVGTPLYMSPEQAAGDSVIDGRSDLYSLGVIGYRMVAGRLPIEGTSAQDVMRRHVMQDPAPLSGIAPDAPSDLTWAVTRCLDKDPTRRWPTVEAFRQALESGDEAVTDLPEPLEHLSGRAVIAACTGWVLAVAATFSYARSESSTWILVAGALLIVALASLVPAYLSAQQFGLSASRTWRLLAAPPERWAGWWPRAFRRSGDVWDQLPPFVRRYRAARTAAVVGGVGLIAPIVIWLTVAGLAGRASLFDAALWVFVSALAVSATMIAAFQSSAQHELRGKGVQGRLIRKWLTEPTWGSTFWRRSEAAPLLAEPKPAKTTIDTSPEDQYCITTPTQPELPQGMFDHVDPRSPTPLYAQIASRLRVAIASGELRPGDGLPSVRQLAGRLRINPATVVQAYRELEVEGLVNTKHGAGTFVQEVAADRRFRDRELEARRLIRELLAEAGSIGITAAELRTAMEHELNSGKAR
jgi:DNA-binding transcriptional regulator YhcF (GntR family)